MAREFTYAGKRFFEPGPGSWYNLLTGRPITRPPPRRPDIILLDDPRVAGDQANIERFLSQNGLPSLEQIQQQRQNQVAQLLAGLNSLPPLPVLPGAAIPQQVLPPVRIEEPPVQVRPVSPPPVPVRPFPAFVPPSARLVSEVPIPYPQQQPFRPAPPVPPRRSAADEAIARALATIGVSPGIPFIPGAISRAISRAQPQVSPPRVSPPRRPEPAPEVERIGQPPPLTPPRPLSPRLPPTEVKVEPIVPPASYCLRGQVGTGLFFPESDDIENVPVEQLDQLCDFSFARLRTKARIMRVIDGDTFDIAFFVPMGELTMPREERKRRQINIVRPVITFREDRGFFTKMHCRLYGADAYEKNTPPGRAAKKVIEEKVASLNNIVYVNFAAFDKYGRPLVDVYDDRERKHSFSQYLLDYRDPVYGVLAEPYFGGTKSDKAKALVQAAKDKQGLGLAPPDLSQLEEEPSDEGEVIDIEPEET